MPTIIVLGGRDSGPTIKEIEEKAGLNATEFQKIFQATAAEQIAVSISPDRKYYAIKAHEFFQEGDVPNTILFLMRWLALAQLEGEHEELSELQSELPRNATTH